ncbi:hypothetical protein Arub01_29570 [Actinomadura rubrobrunea]|uniref:Uncharacterized protein n=1 Tax=Actinomadura rubrobrunea TaxID=115335 RepID=A0A9W6UW74_9ACTN|nr:hypothetical protein Arub01_29570 [Actinomadura rubrobrunea]
MRSGTPAARSGCVSSATTLICEVSDGSDTAPHLRRARAMDEGLVLGWCGRRCGGPEEPVSSKRPCDGTAVPYLGTPP